MKKQKNVYFVAARIIVSLIKSERSLKPLLLILGNEMFYVPTIDEFYYGSFIKYISYCRDNNYAICV